MDVDIPSDNAAPNACPKIRNFKSLSSLLASCLRLTDILCNELSVNTLSGVYMIDLASEDFDPIEPTGAF